MIAGPHHVRVSWFLSLAQVACGYSHMFISTFHMCIQLTPHPCLRSAINVYPPYSRYDHNNVTTVIVWEKNARWRSLLEKYDRMCEQIRASL